MSQSRGRPAKLDRQHIIDTALMALKMRKKIPSLRGLATNLGVDTMALYHYFENKEALMQALCTCLIDQLPEAPKEGAWVTRLLALCQAYRGLLSEYPGLLPIILAMADQGPTQAFAAKLADILPKDLQAGHFVDVLVDMLHGYALAEEAQLPTGVLAKDQLDKQITWLCNSLQR